MYTIKKLYGFQQGQEFFQLELEDGQTKIINIWDYTALYQYPKLYEKLIVEQLECNVYSAFETLFSQVKNTKQWRILDVACGSGLMGKYLKKRSSIEIELLVGIDILPAALTALKRDNPHIYDQTYLVEQYNSDRFKKYEFNCIIFSAAANHLDIHDYQNYLQILSKNAYILFNLTNHSEDKRRVKILRWMNENFKLCFNMTYTHRKLMNNSSVEHEVFLYRS
ncbi:MAG: class I SAM-dependent methyltransferase [Cyanobacteria bacterium SID2]|nr:class I SAM-dependent methyltransferase [Cyanobacteria bacterium SID2]MBP0003301.1 class I SAM-dependent methyltransferase [Cyanobacteria bacterium SBC]